MMKIELATIILLKLLIAALCEVFYGIKQTDDS